MAEMKLCQCDFQVQGSIKVQFLRIYLKEVVLAHGVTGWLQGMKDGSIIGKLEGYLENITAIKNILYTECVPDYVPEMILFSKTKKITDRSCGIFKINL